jgi:hemerythrin superfamily protein
VQDTEVGEPIIQGVPLDTYNWSDTLHDYYLTKLESGKEYDTTNEHQLYNKFPSWLLEAEEENDTKHLKQMIQIVSVYFDDLYNKIGEISQYKHQKLESDSDKVYPFYDKILTSTGFDVTDLFTNLDIVEKVSSRDDLNLFDESVEKVKNKIYQNIYNNLSYILKAKGTEKSLKSLLRAYGVGDNLVKINLYGDRDVYNVGDRSEEKIVKKKTIDLGANNSTITVGDIPAGAILASFTYEAQFILPKRAETLQSCSLMGINHGTDKTYINILTDETGSVFALVTGSQQITSSKFVDLYDNRVWNIALRGSPDIETITNNTISNYNIDYLGYSYSTDSSRKEFSGSLTITASQITAFLESVKTLYVGADSEATNVKVLDIGYWSAYLEDDVIAVHSKDITNYGTSDITENIENRVFYADLEGVSGSDGTGEFVVQDLFNNYNGIGSGFVVDSTGFIKKEDLKTYKTLNFDTLQGIETIQTLEEDDETTRSLRKKPTSIQLLVENSMYQIISEEMIDMFANVGEYMFAFAEGGNRYKDTYSRLDFLRGKFFDKIVSNPDIEKYLEFYKWIDSALGHMIDQLKPETANGISGLKNTIESHMLERNKFEHKLPLTVGVNPSNVYGNRVHSIGPIVQIDSTIKPDTDVLLNKKYRGMVTKKDITSRDEYIPVVSIENIESKNYNKKYEVVQGAGKAINHRNGKTGDVIFKTNFSAGDNLSELNRDSSGEYSIYNSLLNKSKEVREEYNILESQRTGTQGAASATDFQDNGFIQRNIPYIEENYVVQYSDLQILSSKTVLSTSNEIVDYYYPPTSGSAGAQISWMFSGFPVFDFELTTRLTCSAATLDPYSSSINQNYNVTINGQLRPGSSSYFITYTSGSQEFTEPLISIWKNGSIYELGVGNSVTGSCVKPNIGDPDKTCYYSSNFMLHTSASEEVIYTKYETRQVPYQAIPAEGILNLRRNNILEINDILLREPPVEWNVSMFHNIKMPSAFENMEILSPYGSKLNKLANIDIISTTGITASLPEAIPAEDKDTFYRKIDNLDSGSVQVNRVEHLEYVFPKRKLMGMRESRTKSLYPEVSGTFDTQLNNWDINSYNRKTSLIRSFWRGSSLDRRRTRGADITGLTGSINVLNSYNLSSDVTNIIVDKTGSIPGEQYNVSGSYYIQLYISGSTNRYDSIYSMDSSGSITYSGSN